MTGASNMARNGHGGQGTPPTNALENLIDTPKKKRKPKPTPPCDVTADEEANQEAKARADGWVRKPRWRERHRDENRTPMATLHNAREAILTLGIECKHDTFHEKILVTYRGRLHDIERLVGEVTDANLMALRQLLSSEFGFDPGDKSVCDAVLSLAYENRVDPVADFLDEAEARWDGVERLDRVAAEYFNCEDTPLNAACMRKVLIAAVARVRNPGCKFDTIAVLESEEGYNKSGAWRALAGDENFSDESIIGKDSREVQEQISGVWIHESADLAGMQKREVEAVKAFASRQVDRARPAYARFVKQQKRRCVMVGTTNASEYLQSQTGNRRFWPMTVLAPIDIDRLAKDRMQIWGEAAHRQREGESLVLDQELWADAAIEQDQRRVKDPWEVALADMGGHVHDGEERIGTAEILEHLEIEAKQMTPAMPMRIANVMKALGWQRHANGYVSIKGHRVKGYWRPTERQPPVPKPPLPAPRRGRERLNDDQNT
jgi:predicted P-loop ATPase